MLEDSDRRRVRSAARAILGANDSMPVSRREELLSVVQTYFCMNDEGKDVTEEMLHTAANLETR